MSIKTQALQKKTSAYPKEDYKNFNDTLENAKKYAEAGFDNTYYLGYRDLPVLFEKYTLGKRAIDYGCGAGRSSRFLRANGFEVIGVDISQKMLTQATKLDSSSRYVKIKSAKIPAFSDSCDLVFACFVMFTVESKEDMLSIFNEAYRCLREGGIFIIVTGTEELYRHEWLSYTTNFDQNRSLNSGDIAKIKLRDLGIEFINYFWTDEDFENLTKLSKFKILEKHYPLGKESDKINWITETKKAPYVVYVLQKGENNER